MKIRIALLAMLALVSAACDGNLLETTAPPTSTSAVAAQTPEPDFAWDFSGSGHAATGHVDVEFSGAYEVFGSGVSFDGHSGAGTTSASGPIDTSASFTVSAWVNYAAKSEIAAAVSQLGEVTGIFQLGIGENSQWWFMMKTKDETGLENSVWVEGTPTAPSKSWVHLVGVSDQHAGILQLFINGDLVGETAIDAPLEADGPLTIGRAQFDSAPGNFWPGSIDSVAIYLRALTGEQISEIHGATKPVGSPPPLPAVDASTHASFVLLDLLSAVLVDPHDPDWVLAEMPSFALCRHIPA